MTKFNILNYLFLSAVLMAFNVCYAQPRVYIEHEDTVYEEEEFLEVERISPKPVPLSNFAATVLGVCLVVVGGSMVMSTVAAPQREVYRYRTPIGNLASTTLSDDGSFIVRPKTRLVPRTIRTRTRIL